VKKCLLCAALTLFVATLSKPPIANADSPTCGPDGCQKPGVRMLLPTGDAPTCGPDGCQKPGVHSMLRGTQTGDAPTCGPNGCQKPGLA